VPTGALDITLYRDDLMRHAVGAQPVVGRTDIPFSIDDRVILLVDDVLYTGRTIRAVINELFDYGRPASVKLAVLVDRGGRELPVQADFAAARVALPATQSLALARADDGRFSFEVEGE
jgi:pyrimidine operon attenuation protein/uracil phosphoribosyltransferase